MESFFSFLFFFFGRRVFLSNNLCTVFHVCVSVVSESMVYEFELTILVLQLGPEVIKYSCSTQLSIFSC